MTAFSIDIPQDKHVLVAGMTGSGKSVLCEEWLKAYQYVVKLDTKNEVQERRLKGESPWRGLKEGKDFSVINHLEDIVYTETEKIIYAPVLEEMTLEYYDSFFKWIFERGNTVLWVDEVMSFTTAQKIPYYYKAIMIMGRSRNIGCWSCSQRPQGIPTIIGTNCSYFMIFYMNNFNDRKKMVEFTGCDEVIEPLTDYYFWLYKIGELNATKCRFSLK